MCLTTIPTKHKPSVTTRLVESRHNAATQRYSEANHERQLAVLRRTDALTKQVDKLVRTWWDKLMLTLAGQPDAAHLAGRLRAVYPEIVDAFMHEMVELGVWSFEQSALCFAKALPVEAYPLLLKEDTAPDGSDQQLAFALFDPPDEQTVLGVVLAPTNGLGWRARLDRWSKKITDKDALANTLATKYSQGANLQELASAVRPLVNNISSSAKRIARTEGMRIADEMNEVAFAQSGDLIQGFQLNAVLDSVTRPEHAARNGKVYSKNDPSRPRLPDEPNCRCWYDPILVSDEDIAQLKATGGPVGPSDGTPEQHAAFAEWFNDAPPAKQKAVLGPELWARANTAASESTGTTKGKPRWSDVAAVTGKPGGRATPAATPSRAKAGPSTPATAKAGASVPPTPPVPEPVFSPGSVPGPLPAPAVEPPPAPAPAPAPKKKKPPLTPEQKTAKLQAKLDAAKKKKEEAELRLKLTQEKLAADKAKLALNTPSATLEQPPTPPPKTNRRNAGHAARQQRWESTLPEPDKEIINRWTGSASGRIRGTEAKPESYSPADRAVADHFNRVLDQAPKYTGKTWRGLKLYDKSVVDGWTTPGMEITLDASASSSRSKVQAARFASGGKPQVLLEVRGKSGVQVENLSRFKEEKEVILRKGARFRVVSSKWHSSSFVTSVLEEI